MNDDNGGNKNIIDLAGARKRQKTTAKAASRGAASPKSGGGLRVWHWLQFVGFLLVTAYLMTLCKA